MLTSYICPVATIVENTGLRTFPSSQKILLDRQGDYLCVKAFRRKRGPGVFEYKQKDWCGRSRRLSMSAGIGGGHGGSWQW